MPRSHRLLPRWSSIVAYLRDPKTNWKPKALCVLAILYLLFPLDLLPDVAPVIGWLDDLGGLTIASLYLLYASRKYEASREQRSLR